MPLDSDIKKAIARATKGHNIVLAAELRKYRIVYRRAIGEINNLIISSNVSTVPGLGRLIKKVERRIEALSRKLSRSAKASIGKGLKTGMLEAKASMEFIGGPLRQGAKIGLKVEVFQRVWKAAFKKLLISTDGIELSRRIWDMHQISMVGIRKVIAQGYMDGLSVGAITKQIKGFLLLPDVDMRTRYWKEWFKAHPPGRGVYRSAYKNMDRLLTTEVDRAYRQGTAEYAKKKVWAQGIQWHRIAGHGVCSTGECDEYQEQDLYGMGAGVYPPDALPISHPLCQCYITIVINPAYLPAGIT